MIGLDGSSFACCGIGTSLLGPICLPANVASTAPCEHRYQVRLPLMSTRGRVQIGSSREPNLLPEDEGDALAFEQPALDRT